jgi:hypothetical protein
MRTECCFSSSGLLEILLIYQLRLVILGVNGSAQGMAIAVRTPHFAVPCEYIVSITYVNVVCRAEIVQMLCHTRFIKNINRAIIYAPGSSHAYIQQNHQDITTRISKQKCINYKWISLLQLNQESVQGMRKCKRNTWKVGHHRDVNWETNT